MLNDRQPLFQNSMMNKNQIRNGASQAILLSVLLIGVSGCNSTPERVGPPVNSNATTVTIGPKLKNKIVIPEPIKDRVSGSGLMEVIVPLRNTTNGNIDFTWKIEWYDKDGFEAGSAPRWLQKSIQGGEDTRISAIAKGKNAVTYKLILRREID